MISKNQLKQIRALGLKKQRKSQQAFLVQGEKNVLELLDSTLKIKDLYITEDFLHNHKAKLAGVSYVLAEESELEKASTLVSNNAAIAVVQIPASSPIMTDGFIIALDGVSDPGNLGTIIRLADWYGVKQIVLGANCADPFNPKVISATMGSFTRIECIQTELPVFLQNYEHPIYGAFLEGQNVHGQSFGDKGLLLMGSESHGISDEVSAFVSDKITIPSFGAAESLNVAIATGIILDNIKRSH